MSCSVAITVAMPVVKPVVTGYGMNLMSVPSRQAPIATSRSAGHEAGGEQAREPVLGDDGREDDDERRGRPRHLELAAAEERDGEPGEDRGVEPVLRRRADGDRERHRQRQRHDPDDDAGEDVGAEVLRAVALAQRAAERVARWGTPCRR